MSHNYRYIFTFVAFCLSYSAATANTDTIGPRINSLYPPPGSAITRNLHRISADISDPESGVAKATFVIIRIPFADTSHGKLFSSILFDTIPPIFAPPFERIVDFSQYPDLDFWRLSVKCIAEDSAGNASEHISKYLCLDRHPQLNNKTCTAAYRASAYPVSSDTWIDNPSCIRFTNDRVRVTALPT